VKRIINGFSFNTETSTIVAKYGFQDHPDPAIGLWNDAVIRKTRAGAFFEVYSWTERGQRQHHFRALTRDTLDRLITETPDLKIIDQAAIDEAPEVAAESRTAATIFVRVPADLKRRLDAGARREGKSTNAYALKLFERALESAEPAVHG
jgi:hypothetical protein